MKADEPYPEGRGAPLQDVARLLWRLVALAKHRLLMLDYDGAVAPFCVERHQARPSPRCAEALRVVALGSHTSVAIVTGRPVAEVDRLLGAIPVTVVGEHGWESRVPGGKVVGWTPAPRARETMDRAHEVACQQGWHDRVERKRSGLMLHTRGLPAPHARALEQQCLSLWSQCCVGNLVATRRVNGGVELRARGRDTATAVLSLLSQAPPGTLAAFVGDELTDEDAFRAVRELGFGIRVGPNDQPTIADGRLPSCDAVADFLDEWHRLEQWGRSKKAQWSSPYHVWM